MNMKIETDRLVLRVLGGEDAQMVTEFLTRGKDLYEKYESLKNEAYYTSNYQKGVLEAEFYGMTSKKYLRYYVFKKNNPNLIIGTVSFGNVSDAPYNTSTIGYKFDPFFHGQGYAFEAVQSVIPYGFEYLGLHRLLAVVMPENKPSIKLLEKSGFKKEGFMEKSIKVRGQWEDHFLYALVNPQDRT